MSRWSLILLFCASAAFVPQRQAPGTRVTEPIVIDLAGNGFSFTRVDDGIELDVEGRGAPQRVSWTSKGSDDAFLCIDANKNGVIDVPAELLGGTSGPPNGFAYLAAMDGVKSHENTDVVRARQPKGYLDKTDALFRELILWTDVNHNGRSEEDELQSLEYTGIERIATGYEGSVTADGWGINSNTAH